LDPTFVNLSVQKCQGYSCAHVPSFLTESPEPIFSRFSETRPLFFVELREVRQVPLGPWSAFLPMDRVFLLLLNGFAPLIAISIYVALSVVKFASTLESYPTSPSLRPCLSFTFSREGISLSPFAIVFPNRSIDSALSWKKGYLGFFPSSSSGFSSPLAEFFSSLSNGQGWTGIPDLSGKRPWPVPGAIYCRPSAPPFALKETVSPFPYKPWFWTSLKTHTPSLKVRFPSLGTLY